MKKNIDNNALDRVQGAIVGFMIGDALGLPIAAIKEDEVKKTFGYIKTFIRNYRHPFVYYLKEGQYGSNSLTLISLLELFVIKGYYEHDAWIKKLKELVKRGKEDFFFSRWFGPTTTRAILSGQPTSKHSATCIYRSIPFVLLMDDINKIVSLSRKQSKITHISPISLAATDFICMILFHLKNGEQNIGKVAKESLLFINTNYQGIELLTSKLNLVLHNKLRSLEDARNILGTGSLAHMLVPIALYCVLNFYSSFDDAVIKGANCYRKDNNEERKKLAYLTYIEEVLECYGGDTGAIAGLIGLLLGCYYGYSRLPKRFTLKVEDSEKVLSLIKRFYT